MFSICQSYTNTSHYVCNNIYFSQTHQIFMNKTDFHSEELN